MPTTLDDVSIAIAAIDTNYEIDNQQKRADELGMLLVPAKDNELQIDIDSESQLQATNARLTKLQKFLSIKDIKITPSKTPGHYHMTITLWTNRFKPLERVALQFMLGSDTKRECINTLRVLAETAYPIAFFEPKQGA